MWVNRPKGDDVQARIVAKGYTEQIEDQDDVYASTPLFAVLRILLALSMARGWTVQVGDVSTAFLHAPAASTGMVLGVLRQSKHTVAPQEGDVRIA